MHNNYVFEQVFRLSKTLVKNASSHLF